MKKFISILTTACIAATSMVGATMSSVNAADAMLFTYKGADGSSTVTVDVSNGDASVDASLWITEYAPVFTMGLKMTFYNEAGDGYLPEDNPYFTADSAAYVDPHCFVDGWGDPVDYKLNNASVGPLNFVWQMWTLGDDQTTVIDAIPSETGEFRFIDLSFTVDEATPAGTYTLDIRREAFALDDQGTLSSTKLNNVAGETVEYNTVPLTIVVTNGETEETTTTPAETTTAPAETTTTTTSSTPSEVTGHALQIGQVEVDINSYAEGDYIIVPITVTGDTGTAGITAQFDIDERLLASYVRYRNGTAYTGAPTFNKNEFQYVWVDGTGHNQTAADDSVLISWYFTLPADAQVGDVYPISFNFDMVNGGQEGEQDHVATQVSDETGAALDVTYVDGWVKIVDGSGDVEETTTTPAETTTTEEETTTTVEETTTTEEETTTTEEETTTTTTSTSEDEETTTTTTTTVPAGDALPGDTNVDGRVSIADVVKLNKHLAGNDTLVPQGLINAEVNADGTVDNADSIKIMQFLAKIIEQSALGQA